MRIPKLGNLYNIQNLLKTSYKMQTLLVLIIRWFISNIGMIILKT